MSIPKSVNRTVKRRGLAIATAVAIAGSGVVSENYVLAKELVDDSREMTPPDLVTEPGGNQTDSAINGPTENVDETSTEKENPNQSVTAGEYFNQHESGIVASLRPADISEAPGAEAVANHFLTQAKKDGVAVDSVWESDFHRLIAARERAVLPESYSPSAQDYFDHYARDIAAALRPSDNSQAMGTDAVVAHYVAQAEGNDIDVDDAWKSEFRELVQQLADKLEAEEAGAHRAVLDNELGVNSNPVVDPNKQQLTAEDLAAPFAQHRDEVAEREAAEELAESKSAAVAAIEGAVHLTENQKSQFVDRINASAVVADVAAVLDQAHKLVDKQAAEEADKGTLAKDKGEAHRIIDGLNKLSTEQKAAFKKQVDDANTGAYVAHIVERAQEMNAQQHPSDDGAGAQEPGKPGNNETPGKPGSDNKPGQDQKPGSTTDAFKGFFGLAAGLGVFALIFGGILHTINHFDGFGVVQEHVRNAFAKIGIRF